MFGGHSRRIETSSRDALREHFALVRSVTSLTGVFAGNFVDFQSDFFLHFKPWRSFKQIIAVRSLCPMPNC